MVTIGFDPVIARLGALEVGWHGVATVIAVVVAVWLGVPTHPYPLYEMGAVLVLGLALITLRRRPLRPGVFFLWAALGYAVIRFSLSFVRQETVIAFGLQEAQLVALATAVLVVGLLVRRAARRPYRRDLTSSAR